MPSGRFASLTIGTTIALAACANGKSPNKPDPNMYGLRFEPASISADVGRTSLLTLIASEEGASRTDIDIRVVEFSSGSSAVAALTDSALSNVPPTFATVVVTCLAAGRTSVTGAVTLDSEQRLTLSMPVTCNAPSAPAAR